MKIGSVFAGIGGFDLAFQRAGCHVVWQIEIDRFCLSVLNERFPDIKRFKDIRGLKADDLDPVDLICGGFPCQDFSTAGRHKGLAGSQSGLWWEFHRIVAGLRPAWVVVENVVGMLSSRRGWDMGAILRSLGDLGYWWAYRVLDAQWFGLPQRRKRVFVVGHIGDRTAPAKVLLEPEDCPGNTAAGREEGYEFDGAFASSVGEVGGSGLKADTLVSHYFKGPTTAGRDSSVRNVLVDHVGVRRFTPLECERLQGFPDGWTCLCGALGNTSICTCPHSPRYRALGNAVAVPVVAWIARRILAHSRKEVTAAPSSI